ncbi:LRR receptor-like serine/threonine-protein kinase ERL2 [Camellia lanceoleosa]|uniref:LRR receptor-like serine/threonine-protein kinase ERL2 n=1 Tax=Camellia lanceoleosa TaxID=1840588 RepID=A0ACC0F4R4_9ERIC|nr:LRR receptor-like serine/threonine-protein kinase ERL2 [Camellia lanceoleosa]
MSRLNDYREEEDIWNGDGKMGVIANACKVPTTFVSELTESEDPDECVKHSDEDQELEQLISGEICFKRHTSDTERRIILSGSSNPLHEGHLKLLEVGTRCFNFLVSPFDYLQDEIVESGRYNLIGKALMSIKASFSNIANVLLDWDDVHNDDFFANWRLEESTIHVCFLC